MQEGAAEPLGHSAAQKQPQILLPRLRLNIFQAGTGFKFAMGIERNWKTTVHSELCLTETQADTISASSGSNCLNLLICQEK